MTKVRTLAALLALGSLAALPACSMFGGDDSTRTSRSSGSSGQGYAATTPTYSASPQAAAAAEPLTPDMIRSVQQALQQDNLYRGRIDGVWGPGTQAAVRSYQGQHNLNTTGQLDQETLAAMNLVGNPNAAQQDNSQRYGSNVNPPPNNNPPPNLR